ncbi:hypothetical protein MPH_00980 [Macrophomina phaseolina MS6]|uniref:Pectate lyase n=1 Tax=Macrophomina phaseolina (strain MS6) TaxID=1126212 RepID=K2SYJ8_MACPH|nr:hypothetical protein MPH_00980 [Macrophomina phaseolina MS6]
MTALIPFEFGSPAQVLQQAQYVEGQFDCQGQKYDRGMQCNDQGNTGPENAVFIIAPGGTLSNCVIGPNQIEGIHCEGDCVLENIWVEDVCEDAFTFRQQQGTSYVIGGGAFNAVDKIMNHNGGGTVVIRNFYAEQFVSQNSGGGVGGGPNNQALRGNNAGQPAQLAEGDEQSRSSGTGGGGGSGSGSRFDGTGIDGDGSSFNDPARLSEGPTQQCQYTQADIQNCPPF